MGSKNGKPVLRDEDVKALVQSSGLDEEQVREHFNAFVAEHPNGKMKMKDFREMMSKALPKKDASKMEKHVFRIYDSNNDGSIDFQEFMVVFYIMSDGSPDEVLEKIFRVFDVNSDGTISKKELKRIIKDILSGLIKTDNPEEASEKLITTSAFAEMDTNEDGKVSLDEFKAACLGQEKFSKMLALKVIDIFIDDE
uniref:Neuronal calcium sensor 2 n=1 Tax=Pseudodiaptomus annandalei TaxID=298510 RepID=V9P2U7_9MAXI|nr:neuronal calcium sensor 2 [Pseudodiaptomus annandalei]